MTTKKPPTAAAGPWAELVASGLRADPMQPEAGIPVEPIGVLLRRQSTVYASRERGPPPREFISHNNQRVIQPLR